MSEKDTKTKDTDVGDKPNEVVPVHSMDHIIIRDTSGKEILNTRG